MAEQDQDNLCFQTRPLLRWSVHAAYDDGMRSYFSRKWEYKEVGRIPSPDGLVEAVVVEGSAGATTSTVTSVYLVPAKATVEKQDRERSIFDADHLKDFQLVWREPKLLEVQYQEARIFGFRNFWSERDIQNFHYVVEIRLGPTITNYSLPARDRNW